VIAAMDAKADLITAGRRFQPGRRRRLLALRGDIGKRRKLRLGIVAGLAIVTGLALGFVSP
jgi:hypothetical protein